MSRLEMLRAEGYEITVTARDYVVRFAGKEIGRGGMREDFRNISPFESSNQRGINEQCAVWVAERHRTRHTGDRGARQELAEAV